KCACGNEKSQVAVMCLACTLAKRRNQTTQPCAVCGKIFTARSSRNQKVCDYKCCVILRGRTYQQRMRAKRPTRRCQNCGRNDRVYAAKAKRRFCSSRCAYEFMSGHNSARWRGGLAKSPEERL